MSDYNKNEFNHYSACRGYKLSKDKSQQLTQYVTLERERAEKAEARIKELEKAISNALEISDLWLYPENDCKDERQIVFLVYQSFVNLMEAINDDDT
jgi:hypothetical protein